MSYCSPAKAPESRWMVRAEDGVASPLAESNILETDEIGRLKFLEISYDDAVLIGQLPHDVAARLYIPSKDGRSWDLSPIGTEILGMDARAKQAVEERRPEGREALEERKARLSELAKDDPHPLPYALVQLCLNPKSSDPRVVKRNQEKVVKDADKGELRLSYEYGKPFVRIMDLVHYLAEDEHKHNPMCDFLWRYAYRQIVAEKWRPEYESALQAKAGAQAEERTPTESTPAPKKKRGRPRLSDDERDLARKIAKAHRDGVSFDNCVERFHDPLTEIMRKKWNKGPRDKFTTEQLTTEVKRLWESARKWKSN